MQRSTRQRLTRLLVCLLAAFWLRVGVCDVLLLAADAAPESGAAQAFNPADFVEIVADPERVELVGPDARFSILVHGKTKSGRLVDLTRVAEFRSLARDIAEVGENGTAYARQDGETQIELEVLGRALSAPVVVRDAHAARSFNFAEDIEPLLSRFGCNASGCHGKAEGQNGFKLSVFGFDPAADYDALVKEGRGRRVFPSDPDRSLLLAKAAGAAPHGGGVRLPVGSPGYRTIRDWIAAGMPIGEASDPKIVRIRLTPNERVLAFHGQQQLRVVGEYSDGRPVDVTHLAKYQSNNDVLAAVDEAGLVTAGDTPGQVAVMASYQGAVDVLHVLIPRPALIANYPKLPESNFIDTLVHTQLAKLNILPSERADDAEFLRRAHLDIIGTLPTAAEARRFLSDERADRRARLVDELLTRPEYADYWALKWADLLRVDRQALGHDGAYAYYKWIRDSLAANKPLDAMLSELLTAEGPLAEAPQGHFYRVVNRPGEMAATLSQVFLGVRIACAECHHHPYDRWSQTDYHGMQAYFQQVRRKPGPLGEAIVAEGAPVVKHPRTGEAIHPYALGTQMPEEPPAAQEDRRRRLADELTSSENPYFARNMANRLFAHFLGRGLVEPIDDVRDTNPPTNPELLDRLAAHLVQNNFDAKALIRLIAASEAYGRSSHPNETNLRDEQNYSRALLKRVPAEVLFDAVCQTTGVGEKFDGVPAGYRAIQLWDSQVSHVFLKMFGRPVRVTACECERIVEPNMSQVLHLMNSPEINDRLRHDAGAIARLVASISDEGELCEEIYLTFLSRFPDEEERVAGSAFLRSAGTNRRAAAEDLAWGLLNTIEFAFNH